MKLNNTIKIILGALATIVLGAIGSGFWEKILSPLLSYLSNLITSTLSSLSSSYSNSIYSRAADLYSPNASDSLSIIILFLVFSGLFLSALSSKRENAFIRILHDSAIGPYKGWVGIINSGAMLIIVIFFMSRQATIEQIQSYSVKQMEIVRPYIGEEKYLRLRSDYFRMRSKVDFNHFLEQLYASAKSASVSIDEFTLK